MNTKILEHPCAEEALASLTTVGLEALGKILSCKAGQLHTIAYVSSVREIKDLVKIQRLSIQLGEYENFSAVKESRKEGKERSPRRSNEVRLSHSLLYNTSTKKVKVKGKINKKLNSQYFLKGVEIPTEKAHELIANARTGKAYTPPVVEWRTFDLNSITYFA